MSYDLMVFAPGRRTEKTGKRSRTGTTTRTKWKEEHSYDNPDVSTPGLRTWFLEIIQSFPAMNGPFSPDDFPRTKHP